MNSRLSLVASLLLLAGTTAATAELARITYDDWSVSCNSDDYCIAVSSAQGSNGEKFRLKIERGVKAESQVFVTFDPQTPLELDLKARIEIEGPEDNFGFFGRVEKVYDGNEMAFAGDADRQLLESLRLGRQATVQIEFPTGTLSYRVSLTGITQALLKIDDHQGRIGRRDAIVAWGGLSPDPQVLSSSEQKVSPSASTADAAEAAPAQEQQQFVQHSEDDNASPEAAADELMVYDLGRVPDEVQMIGYRMLDCALEDTVPAFGAQVHAIGDVEMWVVPCRMADANVPYYMTWHVPFDPSNNETLDFETPPDHNQPNHTLVNNLFYDPDADLVTGTTYYSPSYDCGAFERHEFDNDAGAYLLVEYLEKTDCDGVAGPAEGWPLSWTIDEMGN